MYSKKKKINSSILITGFFSLISTYIFKKYLNKEDNLLALFDFIFVLCDLYLIRKGRNFISALKIIFYSELL